MIIVKVTSREPMKQLRVECIGSKIEIDLDAHTTFVALDPDVALALALALAVNAGAFATDRRAAALSAAKLCGARNPAEQESLEQLCDAISDAFESKRRGLCFCGCSECCCCVGASAGGKPQPRGT